MPEWTAEIRRRLRGSGLDGATAAEVEEELSQHLDDRYAELVSGGVPPVEARALALEELEAEGVLGEALRGSRRNARAGPLAVGGAGAGGGTSWAGVIAGDVRLAWRVLVRSPAYALIAVLVIALGMGANTVVYGVIHSVLLRPTAGVAAPDDLVVVHTSDFSGPRFSLSSYPDVESLREATDVFAGVAAYAPRAFSVSGAERSERVAGELVSSNYFDVLGVRPRAGRFFRADEAGAVGTATSVVISSTLWETRFGGREDVIGAGLRVNGQLLTVVGVAPAAFRGSLNGFAMDIWLPLSSPAPVLGFDPARRGTRGLFVVARLRPGVQLAGVQERLDGVAAQLHAAYPEAWTDVRRQPRVMTAVPQAEARVPRMMRGPLLGFFGLLAVVAGLVLLITCANVANLTLARAAGRQSELGVRLALGATRGRIASQLLSESVLLAGVGGAAGVVLAVWVTGALNSVHLPLPGPITFGIAVDPPVLVFAAAVTLATGVLFGLAPALQAGRAPSPMMRGGRRGGPARQRLRSALVVVQMAASVVLLIGGYLFLRTLLVAQRMDPGFTAENVVLAPFDLAAEGYAADDALLFYEEVLTRAAALPGVTAATLAERVPLGFEWSRLNVTPEGYTPRDGEDMEVPYNGVGADYFALMGIQLRRGRGFTEADREGAPPVVVVNETFAARFWPGEDALGRRVSLAGPAGPWAAVVGVVADGKYRSLSEASTPFLYYPYLQRPSLGMTLQLRTAGEPTAVVPSLRLMLREVAPRIPVPELTTLQQQVGLALLPQRIAATLLAAFGVLALAIAAVGLYGIVACTVLQRTREFGIRMALGAPASAVERMVVAQGLRISAIGVAVGVAAAFVLARAAERLLMVSPADPVAYVAVPLVLAGAAALASYLPARRATRANPVAALRSE